MKEEVNRVYLIQLYATFFSLLTLIISASILYDSYLKFQKKEGFYKKEDVQKIVVFTRVVSLFLAFLFLYNTYTGLEIAKKKGTHNKNLNIQLMASIITIIPSVLTLLVALSKEGGLLRNITSEQILTEELNPEI